MNLKQSLLATGLMLLGYLLAVIPSVFMLLDGVSMLVVVFYVVLWAVLLVNLLDRIDRNPKGGA